MLDGRGIAVPTRRPSTGRWSWPALALCTLLAACGRNGDGAGHAAPQVPPAPPERAAPAQENRLVRLLHAAEIQAETDEQRAELRRALQDLRDKPRPALDLARYAAADGQPDQRRLLEVLRAHVVPPAPVELDLDALVAGRDEPAGRAALDDTIARLGPASR